MKYPFYTIYRKQVYGQELKANKDEKKGFEEGNEPSQEPFLQIIQYKCRRSVT